MTKLWLWLLSHLFHPSLCVISFQSEFISDITRFSFYILSDNTRETNRDKQKSKHVDKYASSSAEGNFCDEYENTVKPAILQNYNRHGVCKQKC